MGDAPGCGPGPFRDLRSWLDYLEAKGRLAIMRPNVPLEFGVAFCSKHFEDRKATFFPYPGGHSVSVVAGLLAGRDWIGASLGVTQEDLVGCFQNAMRNPLPWREVDYAPVQEVVHRKVDMLRQLPLPTHNELDAGPYITAGALIVRGPHSGIQNVAIHRLQYLSPNRLGACLLPRHTHALQCMAESEGKDLSVAIAIGLDPATLMASQIITPHEQDELEIAGALHRQPLEVVKCLTNEVRVPANAEIVLEGRFLANVREFEGPFGEFPQYYGDRDMRQVIEIDAICHRPSPLFHTILGGGLEHLMLGTLPREASILERLQASFPNVTAVHLSRGGVCRFHLHVQVNKRSDEEIPDLILGALKAHPDVKHVVVVDTDVDIFNPNDVEWALSTRFQAHKDITIVTQPGGSVLDPSSLDGESSRTGFDATVSVGADKELFRRIRVPNTNGLSAEQLVAGDAGWRRLLATT